MCTPSNSLQYMYGLISFLSHMRQPTQITLGDAELSVTHHRLMQVQCHITAVGIPEPNKGHLRWCLQRAHFAAGQENKQRTGQVHVRQQRTFILPFQLGNSNGKNACVTRSHRISACCATIGCSWCARATSARFPLRLGDTCNHHTLAVRRMWLHAEQKYYLSGNTLSSMMSPR